MEGVVRLLDSDHFGPVNLGNPIEMSVLDVAQRILKLVGSGSEIVFRELPPDDPKVRRPDIRLAQEVLSWSPRVTPDEGLELTLPYFRAEAGRA